MPRTITLTIGQVLDLEQAYSDRYRIGTSEYARSTSTEYQQAEDTYNSTVKKVTGISVGTDKAVDLRDGLFDNCFGAPGCTPRILVRLGFNVNVVIDCPVDALTQREGLAIRVLARDIKDDAPRLKARSPRATILQALTYTEAVTLASVVATSATA